MACLVVLGVMLGCLLSLVWADLRYGRTQRPVYKLLLVLEKYYHDNDLANVTDDTIIMKNVVTESDLQHTIDHCNKGFCDDRLPPFFIGEFFKVVKLTEEFAIVEVGNRPTNTNQGINPRRHVRWCIFVVRTGDDWRVDGMYNDCDGYLPEKYK